MRMHKAAQFAIKVENFISNFLLIGVVFFVFFAAVMRWVGFPIAWSVEFAELMFVWVIFLGSNRTLREDKHISVDFLTKRFPRKYAFFLQMTMWVLMLAFLIIVGTFGALLSFENSDRMINNLPISYLFVTISVPFGSLLMIITILSKAWKQIKQRGETLNG